jgi:alkylation response protein AidB-like acyl-CoA dehydrogenase
VILRRIQPSGENLTGRQVIVADVDLRDTPAELEFRSTLRDWLATVLPTLPSKPHSTDWPGRREYDTMWQKTLVEAGYAGINWPTEYGGRGATPTEHLIFLEESERAGAPYVGVNFVGLLHAGPTIMTEGTAEQKAAHLPAILRGDEIWCQGFSEPTAGSDLASMRTRAVLDGDHYVVNGHKIWTSHSEVADYCELLVRTDADAPKHRGISWLMMPMDLAGIDVRPLKTIIGSTEFSEVFLDDVRIPVGNRIGAENDGWRVTMVTLSFERGTAWVDQIVDSVRLVGDLAAMAKKVTSRSGVAWDDRGLRRDIGHLAAEFDALWALVKRGVTEAGANGVPGPSASVLKLRYTEARQRLMDLGARVLDRAALSRTDIAGLATEEWTEERINSISYTIAAGTSQIQRNIVGERILGLPRER